MKHYNLSKEYILKQANRSLQKVGVDYIDVLLLHRPSPLMDPKEIAEAFQQLHEEKKVEAIECWVFTFSHFFFIVWIFWCVKLFTFSSRHDSKISSFQISY